MLSYMFWRLFTAFDHDDDAARETRRTSLHGGWDEPSVHVSGEALRRAGGWLHPHGRSGEGFAKVSSSD